MRKLKLQMHMTIDGFVAGPEGQLDWMSAAMDDELLQFLNELTDSFDTILMGRKMTKEFVDYWEGVVNDQPDSPEFSFAQIMVNTPKIIFSKTIKTVSGKNTTIENGDMVTAVNKLKNKDGKDIMVYGGTSFVASLINHKLVDELNLLINPVAIGDGLKIFSERTHFTLVGCTAYPSGITVIQFKPVADKV